MADLLLRGGGATGPAPFEFDDSAPGAEKWSGGVTYNKRDAVTYNGSSYISRADGNLNVEPGTDATKWFLFSGGLSDSIRTLADSQSNLTIPQMLLDTSITGSAFAAGGLLIMRDGSGVEFAEDTATDHHFIGAGGKKFYEAGPNFSTRARLKQAKDRGRVWSDGMVLSDGTVRYKAQAGATEIADLPGFTIFGAANLDHWRTGTSAAEGDAAMVQAMAWFNVGGRFLGLPEGDVRFSDTWPAITSLGGGIYGPSANVIIDAAATTATLCELGDESNTATHVDIQIKEVTVETTVVNDKLFRFVNTQRCTAQAFLNNACSLAEFGTSTTQAKQSSIYLNGSFINGAACDEAFLVQNATNIDIGGILNCVADCSTNPICASVRVKPVSGGVVDTLQFDNLRMVVGGKTAETGAAYGLSLDLTDGAATNINFADFCFFDHTRVAAIHATDGASSSNYARSINITGIRLGAVYGAGIVIDKKSPTSSVWTAWHITDISVLMSGVSTDPAVSISGDGFENCLLVDNSLEDQPINDKPQAILANSDGWVISNNIIGSQTAGASKFQVGVEMSNADVVDLIIQSNQCDPNITEQIKIPSAWTTVDRSAPRRIIKAVDETWVNKVRYRDWDTTVTSITDGTVNVLDHPVVRLNLAGGGVITDISAPDGVITTCTLINVGADPITIRNGAAKLRLNGSNDVTLYQHDSVTLIRIVETATAWQQISGKQAVGEGAGGTVTQTVSRSENVTLNALSGSITLFSAANSTAWREVTVTNDLVEAGDVVVLSMASGENHSLAVTGVRTGQFDFTHASHGGTAVETPVVNFCVIKGSN